MAKKRDGTPQRQRGGRPVSEATKAARAYAAEIRSAETSPLKIMAENLQFWHERAAKLLETIEASAKSIPDAQLRSELLALAEPLANARQVSQRCALDAVQFVQPKITEEER
jgi:hypothetical protein